MISFYAMLERYLAWIADFMKELYRFTVCLCSLALDLFKFIRRSLQNN